MLVNSVGIHNQDYLNTDLKQVFSQLNCFLRIQKIESRRVDTKQSLYKKIILLDFFFTQC